MLIGVPGSGGRGHRRSSAVLWGWEGSGWKPAGPAPSLCPLCAAGTSSSRASAVLCSSRTFLLAAFSVVEYPLQLLHSPAAPVVKRPGALSAHHALQVLPPPTGRGLPPSPVVAGCPPRGPWGPLSLFSCFFCLPFLSACLLCHPVSPQSLHGGVLWCL